MRVVCVSHDNFSDDEYPYGPEDPQIGDICVVVRECIGFGMSHSSAPCYKLEGYAPYLYDKRNFAPLSDLDETELVNDEFEEKYCVPVNK